MQEDMINILDKRLNLILNELNIKIYVQLNNYYLFNLEEKSKFKNYYIFNNLEEENNYYQKLSINNNVIIKLNTRGKIIFQQMYKNSSTEEKKYILEKYNYFMTYKQALNFVIKNEKDILHVERFIKNTIFKDNYHKIDDEEKILIKIKDLVPENSIQNLFFYLNNNTNTYNSKHNLNRKSYQGMLKNLVNKYFPENIKLFQNFTGDFEKKILNSDSLLYKKTLECEMIVHINKNYILEKYVNYQIMENHNLQKEQDKIIKNLNGLLLESNKLNLLSSQNISSNNSEIITFYITKEKNDITENDIIDYLNNCLTYWKENLIELKELNEDEMIKNIDKNAQSYTLYKNLNNKLAADSGDKKIEKKNKL